MKEGGGKGWGGGGGGGRSTWIKKPGNKLQITQRCGLCCLEDTTAWLLHCDSWLWILTIMTIQFWLGSWQWQYSSDLDLGSDDTVLTWILAVTIQFWLGSWQWQYSSDLDLGSDNTVLTWILAVTIQFWLGSWQWQYSSDLDLGSDNTVLTSSRSKEDVYNHKSVWWLLKQSILSGRPSAAQNGSQEEGTDQEDDHAKDGKTT